MYNFRVTVNGRNYDVSVTEMTPGNEPAVLQPQPADAVTPVQTPQPAAAHAAGSATLDAGDKPVVAPLSGAIVSLKVKPGESVKYGQVLLTLEALKMENEIVAPEAGTVKAIFIQNGSAVNVGDVLLTLA